MLDKKNNTEAQAPEGRKYPECILCLIVFPSMYKELIEDKKTPRKKTGNGRNLNININ